MITNRSHTQTTTTRTGHVSSIQPRVIKVSRHLSERKKRLNNVIHITIQSTDNSFIDPNNKTRSISSIMKHSHHGRSNEQKSTISQNSKSSNVRIVRRRRSLIKSSRNIWTTDNSAKLFQQQNAYYASDKGDHHHNYSNTPSTTISLTRSPTVASHEDNHYFQTIKESSDRHGVTKDYHGYLKKDKKKCPTRPCVIGSIIAALVLVIIIAIILPILLLKSINIKTTQAPTAIPLLRWNTTGITVAGNANGQLDHPFDVAVDYLNTLYIADYNNNRVQKYLMDGSFTTVAGDANRIAGNSSSQLNQTSRVIVDSNGDIFIADAGNNRVQFWSNGASVGTTVAGLGDTSWTLLAGNNNGTSGNTSTLLNTPADVTFDPMGNMYIADTVNSRVQLFMLGQTDGITIAGVSGASSSNLTMLNMPFSVALDNQLNLYVADTLNQRIQKFMRY